MNGYTLYYTHILINISRSRDTSILLPPIKLSLTEPILVYQWILYCGAAVILTW